MKTDLLRHTEIFIFLAMVFSIYTAALLIDKHKLLNKNIEIINENENLKNQVQEYRNNNPEHIEIDGTQDFYFNSGESFIVDNFKKYLNDSLIPKLVNDLEKCKNCNALYIVGHTDDVGATDKENARFDDNVYEIINRERDSIDFDYNSNTDLGLLRAMSIYCYLRDYKDENNIQVLKQIDYWFPYSAGPFIDPKKSSLINNLHNISDEYREEKRRIELWLYAYNPKKDSLINKKRHCPKFCVNDIDGFSSL
ncbi:hypothetical protein EZY14_011685 [Kordia sp. TARA_039_SRF]|nr:hypothetical protein EZY14_011685 [Kordia sp. TARA_039_SRF]